jgi:ATP-dependent helicase/nuclease subunit A
MPDASTATTRWTPQQQRAIETTGRNILVSAAAGSGKTSVLAERCAYLVCDAPPDMRCDVNELLVVTFTVAAAQEMRTRIASALNRRYQQTQDQRLARQLALIERAHIGTIDSFCSSVVRQWFHVLGIDPNFPMLSEEEGFLMRAEVARQLVEDRYAKDEDGSFQRLVDRYADGNDATLRQRIIRTSNLMGSLLRPQTWVNRARQRIAEAGHSALRDSELGRMLLERMRSQLDALNARCVRLADRLHAFDRLEKYLDDVGEIIACLGAWRDALAQGDVNRLAELVKALDLLRMPVIQKLSSDEAPLREELAAIRRAIKEGELTATLCRFSEDEWRGGMQQVREPANVFLDLVEQFNQRYQQAKSELRVLDFTDLERLALRALSERDSQGEATLVPSAAARAYRKQFRHVLVDEYQDINELQDSILTLVTRQRSQFCVGDVKQSIYRFRLADPQRFLKRYKHRGDGDDQVIDLQTNFRSRAPLLATLNGIFESLMTEPAAEIQYDESHYLTPQDDSPYQARSIEGPHVELHLLPKKPTAAPSGEEDAAEDDDELDRTEREAAFIVSRIGALMGDGDPTRATHVLARAADGQLDWRPVQYRDIVVLLRAMQFKAEQFADMLRAAGIPVHSDAGTGFFDSMEVRDVLALLTVLDNQRQDIPLAALLRSPLAAIAQPEDALARIRLAYVATPPVPFHIAVVRYVRERDDALAARLRVFLAELAEWREQAQRRPLAEVLWQIYDRSGYLAFCQGLGDGEQRVANLVALHERARQFGSFRKQGLGRFMRFLDNLRSETDLGQPSTASEADDVVRVMSIHRSKGLEFPIVFVPDLGKKHNLSDSRGHILVDREAGIGLSVCDEALRVRYPSLASTVVAERLRRQMLAEEMRILYVATTRARERLILVGTCDPASRDKWEARWRGHAPPLPPDDVLAGKCMLDWLGPAISIISRRPQASIECTTHETVPVEELTRSRRPTLTPWQQKLAALEPLEPPPKTDPLVEALWKRLTAPYPHVPFTKLAASRAVTSDAAEQDVFAARDEFMFQQPLRPPRAGAQVIAPTSADIGSATHVFLEHLDLARAGSVEELRRQLESLVESKRLPASLAPHIDLDALAWFMTTDLAALLRKHAKDLRREVPIHFPRVVLPESTDLDRVMMRGRLDMLLQLRDRVILVDFKTDQGDAADAEARSEKYHEQIRVYGDAISAMLGRPVTESWLVFLKRRMVEAVTERRITSRG